MTTTTTQPTQAETNALECVECAAPLDVEVTMAGEILDCPDCGVELEVRRLDPVELAVAPEVEEDWGE